MWDFYLAYSEAGFGSGYLSVAQLASARGGKSATLRSPDSKSRSDER